MLTMKGTLQLNSLTPLKTGSDVLSQKLIGNYQMLGVSIQPQDLLHMTMLPPEVYIEQGAEQYAVVNQNIEVNNLAKVDMVNSFINRMLLLDSQEFTFQDEVYISNFLQKLGIVNVQEFMKVTRQQIVQNQQLVELVKTYWQNGRDIHELIEKTNQMEFHEKDIEIQQEIRTGIRYYLQNDIFNRLQTAVLNNHIYENQKYISHNPKQITSQEFLLSEQIQMADEIQLMEMKSRVFQDIYPSVYQQYYYYEQIPIVEEELTEQTVLKYLSASILNNMVNKMSYVRMQQNEEFDNQWIQYNKAFYGSAENTIMRFEELHTQEHFLHKNDSYIENVNELYKNELAVMNLLEESQNNVEESVYERMPIVNVLQQMQNREKQAAELIIEAGRRLSVKSGEADISIMEQLKQEEFLLMIHQQYLEQSAYHNRSQQKQYYEEMKNTVYEMENNNTEKQWVEYKENVQNINLENMEYVHNITNTQEQKQYQENRNTAFVENERVNLTQEEEYRNYLEQINERNVQMNQKLEQLSEIKPIEKMIVVDRKSAIKKTLEILEHPEYSIESMLEEGKPIQEKREPQVERLLSIVDEPVRKLYETILDYVKIESPEGHGSEGIIKAAIPEQFMEIVNEITEDKKILQTEQQLQELSYVYSQNTHYTEENQQQEIINQQHLQQERELVENKQNQIQKNLERQEEVIKDTIYQVQERKSLEMLKNAEIRHVQERQKEEAELVLKSEKQIKERENTTTEQRELQWLAGEEQIGNNVPDTQQMVLKELQEKVEKVNQDSSKILVKMEQVVFEPEVAMKYLKREEKLGEEIQQITENANHVIKTETHNLLLNQTNSKIQETKLVNLVHRSTEQFLENQEVNDILESKNITRKHKQQQIEMTEHITVLEQRIQETKQELIVQNKKSVSEMIQKNLQTQINTISEQVYQNLEHRLWNERKRRGF